MRRSNVKRLLVAAKQTEDKASRGDVFAVHRRSRGLLNGSANFVVRILKPAELHEQACPQYASVKQVMGVWMCVNCVFHRAQMPICRGKLSHSKLDEREVPSSVRAGELQLIRVDFRKHLVGELTRSQNSH